MEPIVLFVATYDAKDVETDYSKKRVQAYSAKCVTVDVGVGGTCTAVPDVSLADLCAGSTYTVEQIHAMPRGDAVGAASNMVEKWGRNRFARGGVRRYHRHRRRGRHADLHSNHAQPAAGTAQADAYYPCGR